MRGLAHLLSSNSSLISICDISHEKHLVDRVCVACSVCIGYMLCSTAAGESCYWVIEGESHCDARDNLLGQDEDERGAAGDPLTPRSGSWRALSWLLRDDDLPFPRSAVQTSALSLLGVCLAPGAFPPASLRPACLQQRWVVGVFVGWRLVGMEGLLRWRDFHFPCFSVVVFITCA